MVEEECELFMQGDCTSCAEHGLLGKAAIYITNTGKYKIFLAILVYFY